jgi:hypothetical protein
MFESAGGDMFAWLRNLGGSAGTGAMAAPGMAEAGYGLAPGLTQSTSDPAQAGGNWFGTGATNKDVAGALGKLGGGAGGGAAAGKGAGPVMPGAGHAAAVGTPARGALSNLDALVQMLNKQRQGLMPGSATSGQPQGAQPTMGLLGF